MLTFSFSDTAAAVAIELLPLPSHRPVDPNSTDPSSCRRDWLQLLTAGLECCDCANGRLKGPGKRLVKVLPKIFLCACAWPLMSCMLLSLPMWDQIYVWVT